MKKKVVVYPRDIPMLGLYSEKLDDSKLDLAHCFAIYLIQNNRYIFFWKGMNGKKLLDINFV